MNSSQLNFFNVPGDWKNIQQFLNENSIKLINYQADTVEDVIQEISFEPENLPYKIAITHQSFLNEVITTYNEKSSKYELDFEKSPVVEFIVGGFFSGNFRKLHPGRFYCVTNYYARRGELVTKSEAFKTWTKKLCRSFKNSFLTKYEDFVVVLCTEGTLSWIKENNVKLDGGAISMSIV